jgi:hypothetical protein
VTDSRGLARLDGVAHTIFQAVARGSALDLRAKPFSRDKKKAWSNQDDYSACHALARSARAAEVRIIRYESVRDLIPTSLARADHEETPPERGLFVGHDCEIALAGDYFRVQIGDYPVLVQRDREGVVRGAPTSARSRVAKDPRRCQLTIQ